MMSPEAWLPVALILGYLLGSIPFGLLLTKQAGTQDLRSIGSGSIGATNVLRTGRKGLAAATLLCDALKGTVAVVIAGYFGGPNAIDCAGRWWAAGRWMVGPPKTVLAAVDWDGGTLEPALEFPSGGDTSYPGMVWFGGELWVSYYSSHEGKAAIYLARVAFE